jgi:hypothetical protein
VDEEVEEPNELMITCSDEELDGDEKFEETGMIGGNEKVKEPRTMDGNEKVEELVESMTFNSHEEVISYYKQVDLLC